MKKVYVTLDIDEDTLLKASEQTSIAEAISQELGWLHDSGMFVDSWSFEKDEKQKTLTPEEKIKIHSQVEKAFFNEVIYSALVGSCEDIGVKTSSAVKVMQDTEFMKSAHAALKAAQDEFNRQMPKVIEEKAKTAVLDHAEDKEVRHKVLNFPPEYADLCKDILSLNLKDLYEKHGPIGEDPDFGVRFLDGNSLIFKINIPDKDDMRAVLTMDLFDPQHKLLASSKPAYMDKITGIFETSDNFGKTYSVEISEDEMQRRIGNDYIFKTDSTDPDISKHNGQTCHILRQLNKDEADILCTGLIYEAEFEDGTTENVYDYELEERVFGREMTKSLKEMLGNITSDPPKKEVDCVSQIQDKERN